MKRIVFFAAGCLVRCQPCGAAPPPPVESILERCETSIIARVVAATEKSVTVRRAELLRGNTEAELTFTLDEGSPPSVQCIGTEFLLLSQGDAHFGSPRSVIGRTMYGQERWCGWIACPIWRERDEIDIETIWSREDAKIYGARLAGKPMTLTRVKQLMERFPYSPHVNDKT
jgi:hypothetical protein